MALRKLIQLLTLLSFLFAGSHAQLDGKVCGIAPLNPKIVGGNDAAPGSWPWQIDLMKYDAHYCGGSLINKEWVITAAHCVSRTKTSVFRVVLGRQNLKGRTEISRGVAKITVHPRFNRKTIDNDIALLKLSKPVKLTDYIRPVCLAASGSVFRNGTESWVTGWGNVGVGVPLPPPKTLQEVKVPVIGNKQCNCMYGAGTITDNMICAGVLSGGKDSCQGDSGGPMVSKQGSVWVQSGIVSFGRGCAWPNLPGVYTRVSRYQTWIKSKIKIDKPGFIQFTSDGEDPDSTYICPTPASSLAPILRTTTAMDPLSSFCSSASKNSSAEDDNQSVGETWPWMVRLNNNGVHTCAGTLISNNFVLTSAKCLSTMPDVREWTVFLGQHFVNGTEEFEVSLGVVNITLSNMTGSNIALLQLAEPVSYGENIQPVRVDISNNRYVPVYGQCWVAGWTSRGSPNGVKGDLVFRSLEIQAVKCVNVSDLENICLDTTDLEEVDQGGPLVCMSDSLWFQVAVLTKSKDGLVPADTQTFAKTSRFGLFLREMVDNMSITEALVSED